ncbi:response regulator transcription factor [Candidatus Gracilibacteria bacterium 28_42_T64]|nr:response regulator transcription factor [Candidatus Gracilibacteria bacterium 28_42_T64]
MRVLVVEDNEILSRNLVKYLIARDIFTEVSLDGEEGYRKAISNYYDVLVLDINLPGMNGYEICKQIREKEKDISIIMLTSMGTNDDIVTGLDAGADDYVVKPFEYTELLARMNAITRRKMANRSNTLIKIGDIMLDLKQVEVRKAGKIIKMSTLEYDLFKYLAQNRGVALSRQKIYENVWGEFDIDFMFSKTIDVYIGYLRKKLGKELIETRKGFGFLIR